MLSTYIFCSLVEIFVYFLYLAKIVGSTRLQVQNYFKLFKFS